MQTILLNYLTLSTISVRETDLEKVRKSKFLSMKFEENLFVIRINS